VAFVLGFSAVFILLGEWRVFVRFVSFIHAGKPDLDLPGRRIVDIPFRRPCQRPFHFGSFGRERIQLKYKPAGFIGTFLVGVAFAAGWTPLYRADSRGHSDPGGWFSSTLSGNDTFDRLFGGDGPSFSDHRHAVSRFLSSFNVSANISCFWKMVTGVLLMI
jgi:hypothetical protein